MGWSFSKLVSNPVGAGFIENPFVSEEEFKSFIPGIGDALAQDKANKLNIQLDRANKDWMERMSNTAYQRAMDDMRKAGLNPMLAFQMGGASTPSSTAPTVEASSKTGLFNAALGAFTGITAAQAQRQTIQNQTAQTQSSVQLQAAQTAREVQEAKLVSAETKLKERELRGKGFKETIDREAGSILQKILDNVYKNSAKDLTKPLPHHPPYGRIPKPH